jgi:hypothetical protein
MYIAQAPYFVDMLRNGMAFPDSSPAPDGHQKLLKVVHMTSLCYVYGRCLNAVCCFDGAGLLPMGVSSCCPGVL